MQRVNVLFLVKILLCMQHQFSKSEYKMRLMNWYNLKILDIVDTGSYNYTIYLDLLKLCANGLA